ncbi:MAG: efflux RND transporter permease subunit, partial [Burkholderiales bacterium]
LSGIEGIKTIKSVNREEVSQITVEFVRERTADSAANDVRDRVARARARMPAGTDDSVVAKIEADAQAIIWVIFSSDRHSGLEVSDYADRYVADILKTLPGVSNVIIGGERRYAMRLWIDSDRLAAYSLTVQDVENALRKQNVEVPSGRIESKQREFTVLAETDLRTPEQFNDLIVSQALGYPVRLKDIGRAEMGPADARGMLRSNGNDGVGLGVVKQSTANTLAVANAVKAEIPRIKANLPEGMKLEVGFDSSIFIDESIKSVYRTMGEALILVVLVIFLFLRSVRATLIPFVTIPVSLIGSFIFLSALGFSINILTLLGVILAIGLVVDDAIVVLENIHRHVEEGMTPFKAAIQGTREIAFAVVAMTITLVSVFTPLAFASGNTGKLFTEFALTVAAAVLVSGFVALTLTPMMCSKLLKSGAHGWFYNSTEPFFSGLTSAYRALLTRALSVRWLIALAFIGVAVAGGFLFKSLKSELAPLEDRSFFIGLLLAPDGSTMNYTDDYARKIEKMYAEIPEVKNFVMFVAPGLDKPNPVNVAFSFVSLKPWSQRTRSQMDITKELGPKMFGGLPGVLAFPINPPSLGQSFRNPPVQFVIMGNSYEQLNSNVDKFIAEARKFPGLQNLDSDLKLNKPQLAVDVDREKIANIGAEVDVIGRTLETMLGGRNVTRFKREGKQYDVIVQVEDKNRTKPTDLTSMYVRSKDGRLVQLSNLVQLRETVAPKELNHFNRQRAAIISANVAPGYTLGEVLDFMEKTAVQTMGDSVQTSLDGVSREFRESGQTLYLTFALALVFIYLVLAAQFESFISPFIIMLTVPLAMTGALLALNLTGGTLNTYSQIGLIMLVGLITKHGILIVEFANQLREQGKEKLDAVIEAATLRLRPILMTTAAMVLGAVPLAIATGAGAESRRPIGWVIVGGLALGTVFTLFVIPAAYTLLAGKRRQPEAEETTPILQPSAK